MVDVRSLLTALATVMVVVIVALFLTFTSTVDITDVKDLSINIPYYYRIQFLKVNICYL